MIEFKQVTKTFYKESRAIMALTDVSLRVQEGKIFGIIGASGAGKSTLIRCVNGLEKPTSGDVVVDGQSLLRLSGHELIKVRRQIGMIFQHFNLLSSHTVSENIAFPLKLAQRPKTEVKKRVSDLLALVNLEEKRHAYPANISGGQKQRVAIARALASHPKVLLCDEATSALDPASTKAILALLKDINQRLRITILLITHEMDVVKAICDEVAILSNGTLVEQGSVGGIFSNPKTEVAKQYIESSLHIDVPTTYQQRLHKTPGAGKHPLVQIQVTGTTVDTPTLSEASRLFKVDNHIVSARIDSAGDVTFGVLIIEVRGQPENAQKTIEFFKQKQLHTTILGYV
jgi:D-methionine transport system ATP-binding protein